jgi:hypothetical protein
MYVCMYVCMYLCMYVRMERIWFFSVRRHYVYKQTFLPQGFRLLNEFGWQWKPAPLKETFVANIWQPRCNQGDQMRQCKSRLKSYTTHPLTNLIYNFFRGKKQAHNLGIFKKLLKGISHPICRRKFAQTGHPRCNLFRQSLFGICKC